MPAYLQKVDSKWDKPSDFFTRKLIYSGAKWRLTTCIGWRVSRFVGKLWVQKSRSSSGQLRSVHAKKHAGCSWVQGRISCWKKNDLHRLAEALQITGTLKCFQGTVFLVWYWNNSREILACNNNNNNNNGNNFISVFPRWVSTWYYLLFYIIFNAFQLYDILTKRANWKHTIEISEFIFFVWILLFGS